MEVRGELVIGDVGADLEEVVGSAWGRTHLLRFDHAFADDLVHGGLDEGAGDGLPGAVTLPVVWDPVGVGPDVGVELAHRLDQSVLFEAGFLAAFVELELKVLDGLQGAEDVAVPEEPFETFQILPDLAGEDLFGGGRVFITVGWILNEFVKPFARLAGRFRRGGCLVGGPRGRRRGGGTGR